LFLFLLTFSVIFIRRRFYIPQDVLVLSAERTWGMFGFAALAALMSFWGLYAAWETKKMKVRDPWDEIDTEKL
ncbi:MAG: hypothetical protein IH599_00585, partial [Bacteroidales bacterium]|nr:hypothetical protein [Bacteroidales bacterium]